MDNCDRCSIAEDSTSCRPHFSSPLWMTLRLFYALRNSFQSLREYYSCLLARLITSPQTRFCSFVQFYGTTGTTKLDYIKPLAGISKAVYLASVNGTEVVVKFASRYNIICLPTTTSHQSSSTMDQMRAVMGDLLCL